MVNHPDKGKKDGHCNRASCQRPLAGYPQYWMPNHMSANGGYYYCAVCADIFNNDDQQRGEVLRCTLDPETIGA